jgi:prepilin-type processing-associated H-X9-DG protein
MLAVVAIIAFLLAILLPSLDAAREQARRVICISNERTWGVAIGYYRQDFNDFLPCEGTYLDLSKPYSWFNVLPPYLKLPPYVELEGVGGRIKELPNVHVWICPSKNRTPAFKSGSGKNQFHYGMNQVLDGLGSVRSPSADAPDFPDLGDDPTHAGRFLDAPSTVLLFDIAPNAPAGTPRDVATMHQRGFGGAPMGRFHGDYANLLQLDGHVESCKTDDLVTDRDFRRGRVIWRHPRIYWGYRSPD